MTASTSRPIAVATALLALSGSVSAKERRGAAKFWVPSPYVSAAAGTAELVAGDKFHPDAELIALCAQFDALERRRQDAGNAARTIEEDGAADLIYAEVREQQRPILDRICATPAVTRAGMAALAASLALWDQELYVEEDDPNAHTKERLQAALVRSALAGRA